MKIPPHLLDLFMHRMPVGMAICDRALVLHRCNPAFAEYVAALTGRAPEDVSVAGRSLPELLPNGLAALEPAIAQALDGSVVDTRQVRLVGHDVVAYWQVALVPHTEEDSVAGLLLVVTDMTDRVLARELLQLQVADRTRKLAALYNVLSAAADAPDITAVLQETLPRVLAAVTAGAGLMQLLDGEGRQLHLVAAAGLPDALLADLAVTPLEQGLAGWILKYRQPLALPDVAEDVRTAPSLRALEKHAFAGAPMVVKGQLVGVLSVLREKRRPFSPEDLNLVNAVADQIGGLVEAARLRRDNERLAVATERNRLARELHDVVTQTLYGLTLFAETAARLDAAGERDQAQAYGERVLAQARQALREMRLLVHNLRPALLEEMGLVGALRQRLEAVEQRAGVTTYLNAPPLPPLPPALEEALFHVAQEALNNALKHAAATNVTVALAAEKGRITLIIEDNGIGFDPDTETTRGGLGLSTMRERLAAFGGRLTVTTRPDAGTKIVAEVDISAAERVPAPQLPAWL